MRITESRLRQVIREVLSEMSDLPQASGDPKSENEDKLSVQLVYGNAISMPLNGTIDEIKSAIHEKRMSVYEVYVHEGSYDDYKKLVKYCKKIEEETLRDGEIECRFDF